MRHERPAFTVIRRPAPDMIEVEVVHVVQGFAETASVRQYKLHAPAEPMAPAVIHAAV